jgi:hypothetical protein
MRTDWVPVSASALVVGMMALVFGALLNPLSGAEGSAEALNSAANDGGRWLGMCVMYFLASVALTLGLPSMVTLFRDRGQRVGILAVSVFLVGVIGTAGYAMLLVFFRALVTKGEVVDAQGLDGVVDDTGLGVFLYGWIAAFFLGLLLIAIALLVARRTPMWVPLVLIGAIAMFPLTSQFGRVAQVLQLFAMAVAFTGIAIAAVTAGQDRHRPFSSQTSGSISGTNA